MRADEVNVVPMQNGAAYLSFHVKDGKAARALVDQFRGQDVDVDVKKWREKRSLSANAYAWFLINRIAQAIRSTPAQVYREAIRDVPNVSTVVCVQNKALDAFRRGWGERGIGWFTDVAPSRLDGCSNVTAWFGSSVYDTAQMSALIDTLVQEAKRLDIETLPPEELKRMLSIYSKQEKQEAQ